MRNHKNIKRVIIFALCICCALLTACGKDRAKTDSGFAKVESAKDAAAQLFEATEFEGTVLEVAESTWMAYYAVGSDYYTDACVYMSMDMTAEEIAVFTAEDAGSLSAIKTALEVRLKDLDASFCDYLPAEMPKIENAIIASGSNYVIMVVAADTAPAAKLIG